MKNKIVFVISKIDKSLAFEWQAQELSKKYEIHYVLLQNKNNTELIKFLKKININIYYIKYKNKVNGLYAFIKLFFYLKKGKFNILHAHLIDAGIIGISCAYFCRIKKRIYTRHYSDLHHKYFKQGLKYDYLINRLSTHIICISKNVLDILLKKEFVSNEKLRLIHHGFDINLFCDNCDNLDLMIKYKINNNWPVIGVIARYTEWKGIQYIIPAFKKIKLIYPNALLILANTYGDYKNEILSLLQDIENNSFKEIEFEFNINNLYKIFNIYIHVPIDENCEAFGQTYVEALASGIPSIFTLSGIANEFIINERNALVVPYKNSDAIYNSCIRLLNDKTLCNSLIENGKKDVAQKFHLEQMINSLEALYNE